MKDCGIVTEEPVPCDASGNEDVKPGRPAAALPWLNCADFGRNAALFGSRADLIDDELPLVEETHTGAAGFICRDKPIAHSKGSVERTRVDSGEDM